LTPTQRTRSWLTALAHAARLIDECRVSMYSYITGEGELFEDVSPSYRLDLLSSTANSNGSWS
jgi:hypothetical protein